MRKPPRPCPAHQLYFYILPHGAPDFLKSQVSCFYEKHEGTCLLVQADPPHTERRNKTKLVLEAYHLLCLK